MSTAKTEHRRLARPRPSRNRTARAKRAWPCWPTWGIPLTLSVLPLICYLVSRRLPRPGPPPGGRSFIRVHAAQALALSFTALLYTLCGLIVGGVLALDSLQVAVVIAVPLLALL
jgi:hypothetical protein